jgi:pyruvate, water dikinase
MAGGKGASLGEMTRAGFPVPAGFVVLSNAFDAFIEESGRSAEIARTLRRVDERAESAERASARILDELRSANVTEAVEHEVRQAHGELRAEYVAVRSSATSEDSLSNSWAGQLDSYLCTKAQRLVESMRSCWISLFTPRAIFYRIERGLGAQNISVAVVIQTMIDAEVAGVAFSVHPVTRNPNHMIIEAGYGLCEAVVSGEITPDSYIISKNPHRILDTYVSEQNRAMYRAAGGGCKWTRIPLDRAKEQKLTNNQIQRLSALVAKIEAHYGFACDIEWAFDGTGFSIVQSRPITTLGAV